MARSSLQETLDHLLLLVRAGYPVIYLVSHEESRALDFIFQLFRVLKIESPNKHLLRWQAGGSMREIRAERLEGAIGDSRPWLAINDRDPLPAAIRDGGDFAGAPNDWAVDAVIEAIAKAQPRNAPALADSLTVLFDAHPYLRNDAATGAPGALVRPLRNAASALSLYYEQQRSSSSRSYKTIILVAPSSSGLSMELERDLAIVDLPLPEQDELRLTVEKAVREKRLTYVDDVRSDELAEICGIAGPAHTADAQPTPEVRNEYRERLFDLIAAAGRGLTLEEFKRGLSLIGVRHGRLSPATIEEMLDRKARAINSQAIRYTPRVKIELGGLKNIKEWIKIRRAPAVDRRLREAHHLPAPKGVMLCGVAGGGKSQLAMYMAKEFNLALLQLDVGALFGMYVGESEERTRKALQLAELLAPVVLWIDEVDKAFAGVGGDGGVARRVFGYFLTWLSEKKDDIFVVTTANDPAALLQNFPEFGRKGRFDEVFWVGLPSEDARTEIFKIYLGPHATRGNLRVTDEDVTGLAEEINQNEALQGETPFDRFCWLLGRPLVSNNMTGAEIEYAVTQALYLAYDLAQKQGTGQNASFTPRLIYDTVIQAARRVLHDNGVKVPDVIGGNRCLAAD
jgi:hypothetical protein